MEMEDALAKVVAGTYTADDYKKAKDAQLLDARRASFETRLNEAANSDDDKAILKVLDDMIADPDPGTQANGASSKFGFLLSKKRYDEGYAFGKSLVSGMFKDNSAQLNAIAWTIADPQSGPEKKDLDLALAAAQRSVDLDKSYANLDTLARVQFLKCNKAKALELEKEALGLAPDSEKQGIQETIKEYGG